MWATKRIAALALAAALLMGLSSCASTENTSEVLIKPVASTSDKQNVRLSEVAVGSIARGYSTDGSIRYKEQAIVCEYDGASIVNFAVAAGDTVEKDGVLCEIAVDYSLAELQSLEAELSIAKSAAARQKSAAASATASARQAVANYTGSDANARRRLELAAERAEINEKLTAKSAAKSVAAAQKTLDDFNERISATKIVAPADGYIANIEFRAPGAQLPKGSRICTLVTYDDVQLVGNSDLAGAVRYGMEMTISARALVDEYSAEVVSAPNTDGGVTGSFTLAIPEQLMQLFTESADSLNPRATTQNRGPGGGRPTASAIPSGIRLETERMRLDGVTLVPNSAVQTEDGRRFVYVMRDGELRKRFIVTGASDEKNTQVLDGLSVGERVSLG